MAEGTPRKGRDVRIRVEPPDVAPWIYRWTGIPHYYGDYVRELLVIAAILMLVCAPFYADNLSQNILYIVIGGLAVIAVAALTNPWKRSILSADTIVSAAAFVLFETWALANFRSDLLVPFVFREAIAILYLAALYFSLKTLRSMFLHKVGQVDTPEEFVEPQSLDVDEDEAFKAKAREALDEINEKEKGEFTD